MNHTSRRVFLSHAIALTSMAALPRNASAASASSIQGKNSGNLFDQMHWFNDPAFAKREGDQLVVVARPKTDFWRKTFYGYVTDNGHFFHLPVPGDFTFLARVSGNYGALYDQAGLMARIDSANWLKCGIELVDGIGHASVVVTREFSDWSTIRGVSAKAPIWWKMVRKADSLEVLYSLDAKDYTSIRLGYLPLPAKVEVGVMCAAPEGPGFECTFDNLQLTQ
jgi:uncharacterized protein